MIMRFVFALILYYFTLQIVAFGQEAKEIAYGEDPLQKLDVYTSDTLTFAPVMVYVHGGGWQRGDKARVWAKPGHFNKNGWVFVSVNYRLVPKVDIMTQLGDTSKAVAWVHQHIAQYGGDPKQIHLMGHSAGAHHVAAIGSNPQFLKNAGEPLSIVKSVIVLDTQALDVPRLLKEARTQLYSQAFGNEQKVHIAISPIHHLKKGEGIPPFLCVVADKRRGKVSQAKDFQKKMREAGFTCDVFETPEHTHGSLNRAIGQDGERITKEIGRFLKAVIQSETQE